MNVYIHGFNMHAPSSFRRSSKATECRSLRHLLSTCLSSQVTSMSFTKSLQIFPTTSIHWTVLVGSTESMPIRRPTAHCEAHNYSESNCFGSLPGPNTSQRLITFWQRWKNEQSDCRIRQRELRETMRRTLLGHHSPSPLARFGIALHSHKHMVQTRGMPDDRRSIGRCLADRNDAARQTHRSDRVVVCPLTVKPYARIMDRSNR